MGLTLPKQLLPFAGRTVIEAVVDLFAPLPTLVPVPAAFLDLFREKIGDRVTLVGGGSTRYASVRRAFENLVDAADDDLVCIHDAARPFLEAATLQAAWAQAERCGALIYAHAASDTLKRVDGEGRVCDTLDRNRIYHAQTPQIFRCGWLRQAYAAFDRNPGAAPTDEAVLLEMAGLPVYIYESVGGNRKLTHREDLDLLTETSSIGHGYDVHRFAADRPLFLGGIHIEQAAGLAGHSDADVAVHALMDALLGAAGLGDIGSHFPDSDPTLKGIRSTELLTRVMQRLREQGWHLRHADITIQAQVPRLAPHVPAMRACLAEILEAPVAAVNIKATTTDGLGFVGRKEGMAADAVVLLARKVS